MTQQEDGATSNTSLGSDNIGGEAVVSTSAILADSVVP